MLPPSTLHRLPWRSFLAAVACALAFWLGGEGSRAADAPRSFGKAVILGSETTPPGPAYVGMERCAECHADLVEHWRTTPHAHAWERLAASGSQSKPECVRCHSTGFGEPGGMDPFTLDTEQRRDVQCESCHGPAERHLREALVGAVLSPYRCEDCAIGQTCLTCHTPSQDPDFDYSSALKRIAHPKPSASPGPQPEASPTETATPAPSPTPEDSTP